eukprot:840515-Rhodomonas_salina.2
MVPGQRVPGMRLLAFDVGVCDRLPTAGPVRVTSAAAALTRSSGPCTPEARGKGSPAGACLSIVKSGLKSIGAERMPTALAKHQVRVEIAFDLNARPELSQQLRYHQRKSRMW